MLKAAAPSPSAPASRPSAVVRPTKLSDTEEWVEPTPVLSPTSIVHPRNQKAHFMNDSFGLIEPTPSAEGPLNPPQVDDLGTDNIQPNLIDWDDGEEEDERAVKVRIFFSFFLLGLGVV